MKQITLLAMILGSALMGCEVKIHTGPTYLRPEQPQPQPQPQPAPQPIPSPPDPGWMTLGNAYSADTQRQFINLEGHGGVLQRLHLEGVQGSPLITRVAIEYMDHNMQVVDLNERLVPGHAVEVQLDSHGRLINRIIVYSDPVHGNGLYSVHGA
ncbi:MAG TPA: hypothetical protein VN253_28210 [Kofleriaceae bacterium]|nr:hypothetical protein [Kofleriaceae bacterium]